MDVCLSVVCCQAEVSGLLITPPEESYRLWSVVECDLETSWMRKPWPIGGCCGKRNKGCVIKCRDSFTLNFTKIHPSSPAIKISFIWKKIYFQCPVSDILCALCYNFGSQARRKLLLFLFVYLHQSSRAEIFRTRPERPWGPPSLLYNMCRIFPGGKTAEAWRWPPIYFQRRGYRKSRAILVLSLWTSVSSSRVNFIFFT